VDNALAGVVAAARGIEDNKERHQREDCDRGNHGVRRALAREFSVLMQPMELTNM
jgi:hypothetical protein